MSIDLLLVVTISCNRVATDNLHHRLNFEPGKAKKIFYHTARESILKLAKWSSLVAKCCKIKIVLILPGLKFSLQCKLLIEVVHRLSVTAL